MRVAALIVGGGLALACSRAESPPPPPLPSAPATVPGATPVQCPSVLRIESEMPGASPVEVEMALATPIETAMLAVTGVEHVRSLSVSGKTTVWLQAAPDHALSMRPAVIAALSKLSGLPEDSTTPLAATQPTGPSVVVTSRGPPEALAAADEALNPALRAIAGASTVDALTVPESRIAIRIDAERLRAVGLSIDEIAASIRSASLTTDPTAVLLAEGGIDSIAQTAIAVQRGAPVYLRDVATIEHTTNADGPRGFSAGAPARVTVVRGADPAAVKRALTDAPVPPGVRHEVTGMLRPRGCAPLGSPTAHDGDLELLVLRSPAVDVAAVMDEAPHAADVVVLLGADSLLDGRPSSPSSIQVLIPSTSSAVEPWLRWIAATPELVPVEHHGPRRDHIPVRLEGEMHDAVVAASRRLADTVAAAGLHAAPTGMIERLDIQVDRGRAASYGLTTHELMSAVRQASFGVEAGMVRLGGRVVPIQVEVEAEGSADRLAALRTLELASATGTRVLFTDVASLRATTQPESIEHHDGTRSQTMLIPIALDDRRTAEAALAGALAAVNEAHPGVVARVPEAAPAQGRAGG